MRRGLLVGGLVLAGIALLYAITLSQAVVECEACMAHEGRSLCRTAVAGDRAEAERLAVATACAPLAQGVTATLDCERSMPRSLVCRSR